MSTCSPSPSYRGSVAEGGAAPEQQHETTLPAADPSEGFTHSAPPDARDRAQPSSEASTNEGGDEPTDILTPLVPQPKTCSADNLVPYIREFLEAIAEPEQVAEVRAFGCKRYPEKRNGYFDDLNALARAAVRLSHSNDASLVAVTLNPVDPDLIARRANDIGKAEHGTSDEDIVRRRWLLIDFDPVRSSGLPSTDAEHRAAHDLRQHVQYELSARGFPGPIVGDSGNGAHLLYRVDLPNDERSADLLKTFLATLDTIYSIEAVKIDRTTYNAARVCRLPGTKNRKGSGAENRPHRNSKVLDLPESIRPVPEDLLRSFIDDATPANESTAATGGSSNAQAGETLGAPKAVKESVALVERILKDNSIKHLKRRSWKGGYLWPLKSCPFAEHSEPNKSFVAVLSSGALSAGCQKDGCRERGWGDIKTIYKEWFDKQPSRRKTSQQVSSTSKPNGDRYELRGGGIVRVITTDKGGESVTELTNFDARITSVSHEHDGAEMKTFYDIEAVVKGRKHSFRIPATQFCSLDWVHEHLGANAIVYAGYGRRDQTREGIQVLSGDIPERTTYSHLGWLHTPRGPLYLHAGGAIGDPSIRVDVEAPLDRFVLPDPPTGDSLVTAVRASLRLLSLKPLQVIAPGYCALWRAAVGRPPDFSIWIAGASGTQKSERCALLEQHHGKEMSRDHLPGSWTSTANYNEDLAYRAKDSLLCIDDYAPEPGNEQPLRRQAERLLRAQGNRSGRGRLRADATMRSQRPPRGILIVSGEDLPPGLSLRSRIFVSEIRQGETDLAVLTRCQADAAAGLYATAMAAFVDWLRPRLDDVQAEITPFVQRFRESREIAGHARTTDQVAQLLFGFDVFLLFAVESGALAQDEADLHLAEVTGALLAVAPEQAEHQAAESPAEQFVGFLAAALAAERVHLAHLAHSSEQETDLEGGPDVGERRGDCVGWIDGDDIYLNSSAAFATVQRLAQDQGTRIPFSLSTLRKRLHEGGHLLSIEEGSPRRLEIRRTIAGRRHRVLHLHRRSLSIGGQVGQVSQDDGSTVKTQASFADSWPTTKSRVGQVSQPVSHSPSGVAHSDGRLAHSQADVAHSATGVGQPPSPSTGDEFPPQGAAPGVADAGSPLPPALESAIRGALPQGATPSPADLERWRDAYEERAAVLEVDGGLSRAEAERRSLELVDRQVRRDTCCADGAAGGPPNA